MRQRIFDCSQGTPAGIASYVDVNYDPTNGTVSIGNIMRVGGQTIGGLAQSTKQ
jgi:hypothetical protein